jgi:hypothetical protein
MKPILLEIVTGMITTFGHCRHCELFFDESGVQPKARQGEIDEYPPELLQESEKLFDWLRELKKLYKHRLSIRLIDAKSFMGFYKSLRYRIRRYPFFIVDGKETYVGWDHTQLEGLLDKCVRASLPASHQGLSSTAS